MVPVSVRADVERGALGNRVAAMWAPLPVGIEDPVACYEQIRVAMDDLKHSGQAVGAQVLTNLAGFAPPTILSQAARLQARQRYFNLVVTNVPGPQFPLYLLGRRLRSLYPVVPLARRQALGIAVMSYNGHLGFGLRRGLVDDAIISKDLNGIHHLLEQSGRTDVRLPRGGSHRPVDPHDHPADRQHEEDTALVRIRAGEAVTHFETLRQRKDGTLIPISLTVSPILDDAGRRLARRKSHATSKSAHTRRRRRPPPRGGRRVVG